MPAALISAENIAQLYNIVELLKKILYYYEEFVSWADEFDNRTC